MIPVELRLNNFMSYGRGSPSLDFSSFHVACLSGRNGQGKSALLDAITWALWGEARKSSGSHKPDDELIRIGTREMEVELVFDLEGERYRVVRSYSRSATGKTSRGQLELHVYEPGSDSYRPLTAASMRETQERLDGLLGLDYDTFINSAFLLQGRSDEFTKKKPSERKEILGRILNLGRYARLADLARDRERMAKERVDLAEHEIDRLKKALEEEPRWKEERASTRAELDEARTTFEALRTTEAEVVARLARLESQSREAENVRQAIERLSTRREQLEQDAKGLRLRIEEAEQLMSRKEQIERDYERYEKLLREREDLDTKRDLHRGIEKQIEQREKELSDRRVELEKRLHTLDVDLKSNRSSLDECMVRLAEEPALRRALERARAARAEVERLSGVLERRRTLQEEVERLERELLGQREALAGQMAALEQQIGRERSALEAMPALEHRRAALAEAVERLNSLGKELEEIRWQGQEIAEQLKEHAGQRAAWEEELREREERLAQFLSVREGVCPTCGSDLTDEHRREVEEELRRTSATLRERIARSGRLTAERAAQRDALRARYKEVQAAMAPLEGAPEELVQVDGEIRRLQEVARGADAKEQEVEAIRTRLREKSYGEEARARRSACLEALEQMPIDEAGFEKLREEAVRVRHLEEQLRSLDEVSGRSEQLARVVSQQEQQLQSLRTQLDEGGAFKQLRDQVGMLRRQLETVGFSPERFDAVRQEIRALEKAGERLKVLLNAQQNRAAWQEQLESVRERIGQTEEERAAAACALREIEEALGDRGEVERRRREVVAARTAAEERLQQLQLRLGELTARLRQASQDREALKLKRKELLEARAERGLYRHLRAAFGKHGIPSLIIEETLPEIEERANALLDRLTEGRMHVRLETLKDKKSGGTKETLEIIITDEQGVPRAYETFSGGEAFRVNFALRLALAQLLAERSGVRVRTLVIDEGFGTQDAQGVQNMVEAIQVVQNDFDKILVITHLQQLKEAFPVRIEVEKDPVEGSRFEMLGI